MLIFIDESGDQGFGPSSSPYMIFAMVIFKNGKSAKATDKAISTLKTNTKRKREYKFVQATKNTKDAFINALDRQKFDVRAVVIEKQKFLTIMRDMPQNISNSQRLYYFGLSTLMNSLTLKNARVRLDEKADKQLTRFLKVHMNFLNEKQIGTIQEFVMRDSKRDNLIQLADMVVGAVARSYDPSKVNHNRWFRMLKLNKSDIIEII